MPLKALGPVEIQSVRRTANEPLFNSLMEHYHYLSYEQPVGEHLKYLVWAQGRPIACLAWSSAPRHLGSRDRYIGWSAEARRRNIRFIAYNTRFLILPWVRVPHLASHILGKVTSALSDDWERMYGHRFTLRKPLSIRDVFVEPVTGRRTGYCWGSRRARQGRPHQQAEPPDQRNPRVAVDAAIPAVPQRVMKTTSGRVSIDVNLEELDQIIDSGMRAPLSESDGEKLKTVVHALAERVRPRWRTTEKTRAVLPPPRVRKLPEQTRQRATGAAGTWAQRRRPVYRRAPSYDSAQNSPAWRSLSGCGEGKVYRQKEPKTLVRIVGRPPLEATRYEMERLRCNGCGEVFTAEEPEGVGSEKYDETAAAMIAQLRYGSGMPFQRLERLQRLEGSLGMPLPAATQWGVAEKAAQRIWPAYDELIRQAAQGEIVHNDDTGMRILRWHGSRPTSAPGSSPAASYRSVAAGPSRCTSPAASTRGELAEVLKQRAPDCRRPSRCAMRYRATPRGVGRLNVCWPTASRMEDGSLWKWRRTFRKNADMCWRRWAAFSITMPWRGSRNCRRKNDCASIRNTAGH